MFSYGTKIQIFLEWHIPFALFLRSYKKKSFFHGVNLSLVTWNKCIFGRFLDEYSMRNKLFVCLLFLGALSAFAQNGDEAFTFLRFPFSARVGALGGSNVALVERDPSLLFQNPALLGAEMDGMINLNYMNYISDVNVGNALFTKAAGERAAWGVGASFISYGNIKEVLPENVVLGDLAAKDIGVQGFYARDLNERWRAGLSMKFLYSAFADFTSIGLCFDAGLSYYHSDKGFSAAITLKNIGAQLKAYNDDRQKMPWDIQLGVTQKMKHAPIRLSVTAMYLKRWKFDVVDDTDGGHKEDNFAKTLFKHLVFGIDFVPNDNFWVGIGFNPKVNSDMKLQGANGFAGLSGGAGIKIKMFDVGVSVAKYHPSALSMMVSISTTLADFKRSEKE